MPVPIATAGAVLSGLGSLKSLLGGRSAAKRALEARQRVLRDIEREIADRQYRMEEANRRGLYSAAGYAGDAIRNLGGNIGSSLANAGVYNSSATAGAITQAQRDANTSLASLAAENRLSELDAIGRDTRYASGLKLGYADSDLADARQQEAAGAQGLVNLAQSWFLNDALRPRVPNERPYEQDYPSQGGSAPQMPRPEFGTPPFMEQSRQIPLRGMPMPEQPITLGRNLGYNTGQALIQSVTQANQRRSGASTMRRNLSRSRGGTGGFSPFG